MEFTESLMVKIAVIGALGVGAQWVAWRLAKPAIAFMLIAGILAGPVSGFIVPARDFGALMQPITKLAVAVILFEGGLSLNFRELRHAGSAVLRLVLIGVPVGWAAVTAAAHWGAGLPMGVATLFGGILVVTGPTVIGPMLRSLRIGKRPADVLKWEGIVNDPIGALLAVLIYAVITYAGPRGDLSGIAAAVAGATLVAAAIGLALGLFVTWAFPRGAVPEYLKAPVLLVLVVAGFVGADLIYHETGLVTVTVMGVVLANRPIFAMQSLRRFKEDLAVVLVSGLFILLPATLTWGVIRSFEARFLIFLALLLFVARPLTVFVALAFSDVPWRERLFIGWIAPRGIVAVAITGLFALRLTERGVAGAEALIPLSFGVVVATIVAHGFTARPFARALGLDKGPGTGVLFVGANAFTIGFARFLDEMEIATVIVGQNRSALARARQAGIATYLGDILDEATEDHVDMGAFQQLVAATENDSYNALVCSDLGPELGVNAVVQVGTDRDSEHLRTRGRVLLEDGATLDTLVDELNGGWRFRRTRITAEFDADALAADLPQAARYVAAVRADGVIDFFSTDARPAIDAGDTVVTLTPAPRERRAEPIPAPG